MIAIPMKVAVSCVEIPASVQASDISVPMRVWAKYTIVDGDWYTGEYEFIPSTVTRVIPTEMKVLEHNITINPIPSDWGHITWNGSVLTVS